MQYICQRWCSGTAFSVREVDKLASDPAPSVSFFYAFIRPCYLVKIVICDGHKKFRNGIANYMRVLQISLVAVVIVAAVAIALPPVSLSQMQQKVESMMQGEVVAMDQEEAAQLPSDTSSRDFVKTECQVRNNQLLKQSSQVGVGRMNKRFASSTGFQYVQLLHINRKCS